MLCTHAAILRDTHGHCVVCVPVAEEHQRLDPAIALRHVRATLCRQRLSWFVRYGWHVLEDAPLEWWWHLDAICDHVQWVLEGWMARKKGIPWQKALQDLLINVPPGTLKSRIVSVYAPAWMWLQDPTWTVICLSANPEVARRDADFSRQVITSDWYQGWFQPEWFIREDKDAVSSYGNNWGGMRTSKGWFAKITGQRSDCLIADDPNDVDEVYSDLIRRRVNRRWLNAIRNRVNDPRKSVRIMIQQRAHDDDFSAAVLRQTRKPLHLCLPVEYEPDRRCNTGMPVDTNGRYSPVAARDTAGVPLGWCDPRTVPGEILHPERFTPEVISDEKASATRWAAQYQQRPDASGGSMFNRAWFRWWKPDGTAAPGVRPEGATQYGQPGYVPAVPLPRLSWVAMSVDCAFKETTEGSRVSVQVWGGRGADRFLLDCVTRAMDFVATLAVVKQMHKKWSTRADHKAQVAVNRLLIEDKANGPAVISSLTREISGVVPIEPEGGKQARGMAVQPQVESGNVYLPEGAPWLEVSSDGGEGFWPEVTGFPNKARDDQPDAMTQLLNYYAPTSAVSRAMMLAGM